MENIRISLAEVQSCADSIKASNQLIYEILGNAKAEMDKLQAFWQSESSDTLRQRFSQFATQFETQREIIASYAQFLEHTIQTYDALETAINSNASSF